MKLNKIVLLSILALLLLVIVAEPSSAQCAMCKATVEKSNGRAEGLNRGILYLMSMPYLIGGVIGFFWYKNTRKKNQ